MNPTQPTSPVTESDLHAFLDSELPPERQREVRAWLDGRPEEARRIESYRLQKRALRALFDPVLDEELPARVRDAARPRRRWQAQRWVAGLAMALLGGAAGWGLRGELAHEGGGVGPAPAALAFAQRAAVAHAVFTPDLRRPVEVDAAHEEQLVAWLSRRLGTPLRPPRLQSLGYALEGGRLLAGGQGPVAQFMYRNAAGSRLTLYVSDELAGTGRPPAAKATETAFRFARQGMVNTFYWVDGAFAYAISAEAGRELLERVSAEVYRQMDADAPPARK